MSAPADPRLPRSSNERQSHDDVLARYRQLRGIAKRHLTEVQRFLSPEALMRHGRRLGLVQDDTLILDDMTQSSFVYDLAIYTAPPGRSRAIDRYARAAGLQAGSDEALVLDAMCKARFVTLRVERRHEAGGLIVHDTAREEHVWLVDEGLEVSAPDGAGLATRIFAPEHFFMTAGVLVPLKSGLLRDVVALVPQLARKRPAEIVDDRRLPEALYRSALASDVVEQIGFVDTARPD